MSAARDTLRGVVHLYLDVDGVLNAVAWHVPDWPWDDEQQSLVDGYPIRWSRAMVGRVNALTARPDVVAHWLTTWGERAPALLAPTLGLDAASWPVLGDRERERVVDTLASGGDAAWWKLDAIRDHLSPGVPAVWVDDDLARDPEATGWARGRDLLAVSPRTDLGLTPTHLDRIEAYVDQHAR